MRHCVGVRRAVLVVKVAAEAEWCSISRVDDMVYGVCVCTTNNYGIFNAEERRKREYR